MWKVASLEGDHPFPTDHTWPVRDLLLIGTGQGLAHRCISTCPYVAPHTTNIHTLITLGIRNLTKPLVLKARKHRPCGFDSHRPLHFRYLACPCVVLGRDLAYRPIPTFSTRLQPLP